MQELSALRTNWKNFEEIETHLLQNLTIWESVEQWLTLQRAFEPQLQATSDLFSTERRLALGELQARLQRLAEWQINSGESISIDPDDPNPSA